MGLLRDDRGQAIQVGAAILLGFVVIAITMYQVQVVPTQNAEIEFDHNQDAQDDVQDLRNAITNAGTRETSESVSVTLGTRFPARTIFVNPPPAIGVLRTVDAGNVTIENAQLADSSSYGADAARLLDESHRTARIQYEPSYREYPGGPTTLVEHSYAYTWLDDTALPLSRQSAVSGDRLQLTFLDGELSEEGARSVTVDARTVGGPTELVPIEPENASRPIELRLPVATPEQWNESIGPTYTEGETDARVASYDDANGTLTVELDRDQYDLRMARVGVGGGAERTGRYDVGTADGNASSDAAFTPSWEQDSATVAVGTASETFNATTSPGGITGADVDFSYRDPDGVGVSQGGGTDSQFTNGSAVYEVLNFDEAGTVELFVSSGGSSDAMTVDVVGGFLVTITGTNSPVQEGEQLNVTADVENTGSATETQTIEYVVNGTVRDSASVTLDPGAVQTRTLSWQTAAGDAGQYNATVRSEDSSDVVGVEVTQPAAGPTIDSFDTQQRPGGQVGIRYSFQASAGDANLDSATVELRRTSDGTLVDQRQHALSGQQDGVNNEDFNNLGSGQEYELTLTVTDLNGNEATATRTQVAG